MTINDTALEKLKKSREKINARIQKLQAREKERIKKNETRRKFIIGGVVLAEARKNKTMPSLIAKLAPHLKSASDRQLFGLEKSPSENTPIES